MPQQAKSPRCCDLHGSNYILHIAIHLAGIVAHPEYWLLLPRTTKVRVMALVEVAARPSQMCMHRSSVGVLAYVRSVDVLLRCSAHWMESGDLNHQSL